jgi:hypothetical protein
MANKLTSNIKDVQNASQLMWAVCIPPADYLCPIAHVEF